MTLSWGTLWNVSDETPSNSHRFIELGGVELMMVRFLFYLFSLTSYFAI